MQQLSVLIGTWAALLLSGSVPCAGIPQAASETEAVIRAAVDQHFALMPESWRQEYSRRLAARLDNPQVAAPMRARILKECERLIDTEAIPLLTVRTTVGTFPAAAPSEESILEGVRICSTAVEATLKNAVLYAPLSEEEKAARRSDLKAIEREATRILDERIVGDDRARGVVAARVAELFRDYDGAIGDPLRPFLNQPLPAAALREMIENVAKAFPKEKKYIVADLKGERDADLQKLREQGVEDLILGVVEQKILAPIYRASWADQAALKEVMSAEERLREWQGTVLEAIRSKATQQKLDADRLRAPQELPFRAPRPTPNVPEGHPSSADPPARQNPKVAVDGPATTPGLSEGLRWPLWAAVAATLLVVSLVLLRRRRGKAA
jgi:hypothetical protein